MSGCVFCAISAGRMPASVVWRDERAMVILDLFPLAEGHALVIPHVHAPRVNDLDDDLTAHLFSLAKRVIAAQRAVGLPAPACNLLVNDGKAANQHVPHVHLHVIPRRGRDLMRVLIRNWTRFLPFGSPERRRHRLDALARRLAQAMDSAGD